MKKTNLIEILSTFTTKELKEFGDFLDSPYFNKSNNVNLLFSCLKKLHPGFPKESIEKEIVFKKVFDKDDYNDGFMRLQIHTLNKLAEDFISISKFQQSIFLKDRFLLEYYVLDKKAPRLFEKKYSSVKEKNSKKEIKDADYFLNEYEVDILYGKYKFLIDDNVLNITDLPKEEYLKKIEFLKNNFFITILNQYRFLLNTKSLLNVSYEDDFREVIIKYISSHPEYMNIPILKLHYLELLLLLHDDEKYYFELKSHLTENFSSFSWGEKFSTMCILENFCLAMLYKDKTEYHEEKHTLHKFIIEHKLFSKYEGGKMTDTDFQNITSTGIRLGKLDWVEKFINEYKDFLEEKDKDNVLNLCNTKLNMHHNNFDKALEFLDKITDIDDVNYKVSKKCLTLEIYFEKGLFVEAFTFIDNFKHFIANDRLMTETDKDRMSKFIKFTNDLLKIKNKKGEIEIHFFKKELDETNNVYNKKWLLKKADELNTDKKSSYA